MKNIYKMTLASKHFPSQHHEFYVEDKDFISAVQYANHVLVPGAFELVGGTLVDNVPEHEEVFKHAYTI